MKEKQQKYWRAERQVSPLRAILSFVQIPRVGEEKEGDTKSQSLPFLIPINPAPVYKIKEDAVSCNRVLNRGLCHALIYPRSISPIDGKPGRVVKQRSRGGKKNK